MRKSIQLLLLASALLPCRMATAQQPVIDVIAMHQLIDQSKTEYEQQLRARDRQAAVHGAEAANRTILVKLTGIYRTLVQRYAMLGTAISAVDAGAFAVPVLRQIIWYQRQIAALALRRPAFALLAIGTGLDFARKAESLLGYVTGLTLSGGDLNQMEACDRKLLFDYALSELNRIRELSGRLLQELQFAVRTGLLETLNPFSAYTSADRSLAENIIQHARYIR